MAPSVAVLPTDSHLAAKVNGKSQTNGDVAAKTSSFPAPLRKTGVLDAKFNFEEVTPVIGREYPTTNIVDDLLNGQDGDALLRDLAITSGYPSQVLQTGLKPRSPY